MIPIPGILIALATFPGVIVHEAAHMLFCKLRRKQLVAEVFRQPARLSNGAAASRRLGDER